MSNLRERLAYNQISEATGKLLRQNKAFIMAELPSVLDDFYDHVSQHAETRAFFKSREHMNYAKNAQIKHSATIMDGLFDETYETSINRIGETQSQNRARSPLVHRGLQRPDIWSHAAYRHQASIFAARRLQRLL